MAEQNNRIPRWRIAKIEFVAIAVGLGFRLWIVIRGGQFFWPDESRYDEARIAVAKMADGAMQQAWVGLLSRPDHLGFKLLGLIPAWLERGGPNHSGATFAAAFFAAFSVISLVVLGQLVRRMGGTEQQATWTVVLAVVSTSMLYYCRHLLPYDVALCFGLAAWLWAFRNGAWAAVGTGAWAALCFLTYNGYWMMGGAAMVAAVLRRYERGVLAATATGLGAAAGLVFPLIAVIGAGAAMKVDVLAAAKAFSGTIITADIGQGGRTMAGYLWQVERLNVVVMLAVALVTPLICRRLDRPAAASLIVLAALGFVIWSLDAVWQRFVVHGRSVRQIMPFLLIAAGCGFATLVAWRPWSRRLAGALVSIVLVQAGFNLGPVLSQWFPEAFRREAQRRAAALRENGDSRNHQVAFASFYFTPATIPVDAPPGAVIWQEPHPFEFEPYLFEGFTDAERKGFRQKNFSMRLITLGADEFGRGWRGDDPLLSRHGGFPGSVRIRLRFPRDRQGAYEPLIVTGESGRGDLLYAIYVDSAHVRFGFDHWGIGGSLSEPMRVPLGDPVELIIAMGSLFPEYAEPRFRHRLLVVIDGKVAFDQHQEFHPSEPGSIVFGLNLIGGGTAHAEFTGVIEAIESFDP